MNGFVYYVNKNWTRKRGNAQRDGRPLLFYRRRTFVTIASGVGWGPVSVMPSHCPTPKTPTLVRESGTYLLYKPSYSQFYVQIVEFSLPWQQGSVRSQFEWHRETGQPRNLPVCHKNLQGRICYTDRVIANFVFKLLRLSLWKCY